MFIPAWLLVVVAAVVLMSSRGDFWGQLGNAAKALVGLILLASLPATAYFVSTGDRDTARITSLPFIACMAWGVFSAVRDTARRSLWLHERRVWAARSPEKVAALRRGFAEGLSLGLTLWRLYENVKHFPDWYRCKNPDGTAWSSKVVPQDDIRRLGTPDEGVVFGLAPELLDGVHGKCIAYRFTAQDRNYVFCSPEGTGSSHDADGVELTERVVWVVEAPRRVVLKVSVYYYHHVDSDTFSHAYVHAFKPGKWTPTLLSIGQRVDEDERQKHERWRKQWEHEQADKNFV